MKKILLKRQGSPAFLICASVLLCAWLHGETLFQDSFDEKNTAWVSFGWEGYTNAVGGGITGKEASSAPGSIAVNAVSRGYAGWVSPMIKMPPKGMDIVLKIKLKISTDYVNNAPYLWVAWHGKYQFLNASAFSVAATSLNDAKNGWTELSLLMSTANAPTNADGFKINLTSRYAKGSESGMLHFDDCTVQSQTSPAPAKSINTITSDAAWNRMSEGAWSWDMPQAKVNPTGNLEWMPEPFVFRKGKTVRYIDYENGDDQNSGDTTAKPWKHHPWDTLSAAAHTHKSDGVDTYVFKRGVIYRGLLIAAESGTESNPIRLTSDPSWGAGKASLYGSERIAERWTHLEKGELPDAPGREKIWRAAIGTNSLPLSMWEIRGNKTARINLARFPNWSFSQPDDIRAEWNRWESATTNSDLNFIAIDRRLNAFPKNTLKGALVFSEAVGDGVAPYPFLILGNNGEEALLEKIKAYYTPGYFPRFGCRYYVENAPVLLDQPGEYWYDPVAGRIYLRLHDDRDPNGSMIEAARRTSIISLRGKQHIELSGLEFRFDNPSGEFLKWEASGSVFMNENCVDVSIHHCRFEDVVQAIGIYGTINSFQDMIFIADNEVAKTERAGFYLLGFNIFRVKIMRNRIQGAGLGRYPRLTYGEAIGVHNARLCEIAGNMIEDSGCSGIIVNPGKEGYLASDGRNRADVPLLRTLIHHNKVVNALQLIADFGSIASYQLGPTYVYNNISGNPLGYFPGRLPRDDNWRSNSYIANQFGFAYYLDGEFKNYLFNNIAWGKSNELNGRLCNTAGLMEVFGLNHVFFNNTFFRFGAGLRKQLMVTSQFANDGKYPLKSVYTGNLWADISDIFLDLDAANVRRDMEKEPINYGTLYLTRNAFFGSSHRFGATEFQKTINIDVSKMLSRVSFENIGATEFKEKTNADDASAFKTFPEFQEEMRARTTPIPDIGVTSPENPLVDPVNNDFRPRTDAKGVADIGARCFVPWGLYGVVGEWNFHPFADDAKPIVFGEHMNFTDEYFHRYFYNLVPDNSLVCEGITRRDFVNGTLDNWTTDALRFNGKNAFCVVRDADIKKSMDYRVKGAPDIHYDGTKRKSLDMDTNNFLIEAVISAAQGGGIVSKAASTGYQLTIDDSGKVVLSMRHSGGTYSYSSSQSIADGKWHHLIVEVDRAKANGVRMYLDGSPIPGDAAGIWPDEKTSLANDGDFFVGKSREDRHFKGALDFLRVSRGTLADAHTSIEELYAWEFKGPMMRDFTGKVTGVERSAGAIDGSHGGH